MRGYSLWAVANATHARIIRISAATGIDSHNRVLVVRKRGTTAFMQPGGKSHMRRLGRYVAEAANEPDHSVENDFLMATVQAEQYVAAEIAEIAWIDPRRRRGDIELAPLAEQTVFGLTKGKARVPSGNVEKLFVEAAVPTGPIDQVHFEDPVAYVAGAVFSPHWMC